MLVSELIAKLSTLPQDLEVITDRFSDYDDIETVQEVEVVDKQDYKMRTHPTMSAENKKMVQKCVYVGCWE